jgi:NuA3 HAT complex component NTO1
MKRTTDWQWAHLACGFFIPEVFFLGPNGNDYVHTLHVPRLRFRMLCHICDTWHGACVLCTETGCDKWFHVTCGQSRGLAIEYRRSKGGADIVLAFCAAHTAKWEKDKREKKRFKISSKVSVKKR